MAAIPYDDRDGYIWMDGQFVPWRDTKVHVLTHALHYASAVFEGERAYGGKIFRSLDHSRSMRSSVPRRKPSRSPASRAPMCAPSPGAARR
jgi:branched-chain amino acid aminotransferase